MLSGLWPLEPQHQGRGRRHTEQATILTRTRVSNLSTNGAFHLSLGRQPQENVHPTGKG